MTAPLQRLSVEQPFWEAFFRVAPLVLVATREPDGAHDIAPKHMAMPLGRSAFFGFVCTPLHATYVNAVRTGAFTVNYPDSRKILGVSLSAAPRAEDGSKPSLSALRVEPAKVVDGVLVSGALAALECRLIRTVDDLGDDCLLIGEVVAAHVRADALRSAKTDDAEMLRRIESFGYLDPGRLVEVMETLAFPFPIGFRW